MGKSYFCKDTEEHKSRIGDFYPTPRSLVWCAYNFFADIIPSYSVITEPCCAGGSVTTALKNIGYDNIIENDLYNERTDILHEDILRSNLDSWASEYVVTNFPFTCWDDCVKAFLAKKDLKALITIGRLNYLSTQSRLENGMWDNLREIHCFSRYVDYRTPERTDGNFYVGGMATGWFYFTKEKTSDIKITFCDVQKYAVLGGIPKNFNKIPTIFKFYLLTFVYYPL